MSSETDNPIAQASAVPYRRRGTRLEFCLITSISKGHWGFPKGIIDPGETAVQTALKEAEEEAGLYGEIEGEPLGEYEYRKWGTVLVVTGLLMRVAEEAEHWDEADVRRRLWCPPDEARANICRPEVRELLDAALERIESQRP